MFTEVNIALLQRSRFEMTVLGWETHWLYGKERVLGSAFIQVNADSILDLEGTITIDFLVKDATFQLQIP